MLSWSRLCNKPPHLAVLKKSFKHVGPRQARSWRNPDRVGYVQSLKDGPSYYKFLDVFVYCKDFLALDHVGLLECLGCLCTGTWISTKLPWIFSRIIPGQTRCKQDHVMPKQVYKFDRKLTWNVQISLGKGQTSTNHEFLGLRGVIIGYNNIILIIYIYRCQKETTRAATICQSWPFNFCSAVPWVHDAAGIWELSPDSLDQVWLSDWCALLQQIAEMWIFYSS